MLKRQAVDQARELATQLQLAGAALKDAIESGKEAGFQSVAVQRLEAAATLSRISVENEVRVVQQAGSQNSVEIRQALNTVPVVQPFPLGGALPMTVREVDGIVVPQDGSIEFALAKGTMRDWSLNPPINPDFRTSPGC